MSVTGVKRPDAERGEGPVPYILVAALLMALAIGTTPLVKGEVAGTFADVLSRLFQSQGTPAGDGAKPTPPASSATPAPTRNPFVDQAGPAAKRSQQEHGVPSSVTVAQAILESNWGKSKLATESKNYFGIKCHGGSAGSIATGCRTYRTKECGKGGCHYVNAQFRVYASMEDSFRDHALFLRQNKRYAKAFEHASDPEQFARELQKAGYATDPQYAESLIRLIRKHRLQDYDD